MKVFYKTIMILVLTSWGLVSCKSQQGFDHLDNYTEKKQEKGLDEVQVKYGKILGVAPENVKNVPLYKFIDSWMETPYRMGGETKRGIDCSFFTQFLYHDVYNNLIERTAEKQYIASSTDKFIGQEFLQEGDLLFFNQSGSERFPISHVGVYLGNNRFVHSTASISKAGKNGVQISDFKESKWQRMFVAAGRKPKNLNSEASKEN